jgi:ketosteroid isomerase-like protein
MNIPGMPNDFEDQGKYLTIWEKQSDGSLKIKVEMWNTDVNNMGGQMN